MIICACNKKECSGICRRVNLFRERKTIDCCPAAEGEGLGGGYRIKARPNQIGFKK